MSAPAPGAEYAFQDFSRPLHGCVSFGARTRPDIGTQERRTSWQGLRFARGVCAELDCSRWRLPFACRSRARARPTIPPLDTVRSWRAPPCPLWDRGTGMTKIESREG